MVNFKENYHFSRFLRGSNIFQGGGGGVQLFPGWGFQLLIHIENIEFVIFRGRSGLPAPPPPLDPHLGLSMVLSILAENAPNLTNRYLGMFLEGQVDRQTDRQTDRQKGAQTADAKTISLRLHRGETSRLLSTGYLVSCSRTQRSASGEARTRNPSISGQALYHDCAPQLGSILCRYDTCPTKYAPD